MTSSENQMADPPATLSALERYMESAVFKRRAKRLQKELLARMDRGEHWTFEEVARRLKIPLAVALLGFSHSFEKAHGVRLVPVMPRANESVH
jgi:predicted PP-loop superfamily ATPase